MKFRSIRPHYTRDEEIEGMGGRNTLKKSRSIWPREQLGEEHYMVFEVGCWTGVHHIPFNIFLQKGPVDWSWIWYTEDDRGNEKANECYILEHKIFAKNRRYISFEAIKKWQFFWRILRKEMVLKPWRAIHV